MGISIFPTKGQYQVTRYYDKGYEGLFEDIEAFTSDEPQLNICSGNAAALMDALGVSYDENICGSIKYEDLPKIFEALERLDIESPLFERYYDSICQVLSCAKFNQCSVSFG